MKAYTHLKIVTMDTTMTLIDDGYIVVDGGKIVDLGPMHSWNPKDNVDVIVCTGQICIPGFINAHTHLGLVALRSLADDMPDRLRKFLFPMEQQFMNRDLTVQASKYGAYESLLNGTTTVADMYYYTDDVAQALDEVGIRALVGQTIIESSQIDYQTEAQALEATENLIDRWKDYDLITPFIGPHGTTTVTIPTLKKIRDLSMKTNTKVMMHVAEMDYEMEHFLPKSPIDFLHDIKLLNKHFLSVHTIHSSASDYPLLKQAQASVIHCPGANMKAGKGIANIKEMVNSGVNVALGTDGPISGNTLDLMSVMKLTAIAQKTKFRERDLFPSQEILKMATINGAKALGIDNQTGSIEIGKAADLVFVSTDQANMFPIYDIYATLVYQLQAQNIHTVMVNGIIKVRNHQLMDVDLRDLKAAMHESIQGIRHASNY